MFTTILLCLVVGSGSEVDYAGEVKPILAARCTSCHGSIRQKAGLRLDTAALIRRGGDSGPAVEPGQSGESLLIERVTAAEPADRMPPESEGVPLSPEEIARPAGLDRRRCTGPGRADPEDPRRHWAYQPPRRPPISTRPASSWARNPIDALLAARHRERGLEPAPPIGKDLWLRRVTLDLIGLPPTREELRALSATTRPLTPRRGSSTVCWPAPGTASAGGGTGWTSGGIATGTAWARKSGTATRISGTGATGSSTSLNADKGYDRMVVEMLAGDELAPDDPDVVRATGFLARNWDIFNRNVWLANTVEHTARAFLGVTIQCARCHDHKFDPISQVDYYRLRAFFEPYHIRIDRVPGQPDRAKAGLPRAFDDFLDRPTYLFIRGDESRPDTSGRSRPGTPAVLGGEVRIAPVPLPLAASFPDKRTFVIEETRAEADRDVAAARKAADESAPASRASRDRN